MKKLLLLATATTLAILIAGCGDTGGAASDNGPRTPPSSPAIEKNGTKAQLSAAPMPTFDPSKANDRRWQPGSALDKNKASGQ